MSKQERLEILIDRFRAVHTMEPKNNFRAIELLLEMSKEISRLENELEKRRMKSRCSTGPSKSWP